MNETEIVKELQEAGYNIIYVPHVLIEGRIYTLNEVLKHTHLNSTMFEKWSRSSKEK
jgi:hypothetical protein